MLTVWANSCRAVMSSTSTAVTRVYSFWQVPLSLSLLNGQNDNALKTHTHQRISLSLHWHTVIDICSKAVMLIIPPHLGHVAILMCSVRNIVGLRCLVSNAAFLWGRELVFTGSKLLVFTSNYWMSLIFLQLTTCDHEISSSRECFGTVFVLVNIIHNMVNTSSRAQRNAA